jgi:hypothetical protein
MNISRSLLLLVISFGLVAAAAAQGTVLINNPVSDQPEKVELTAAERNVMNRIVLPAVRKRLAGEEFCEESFEPAAVIHGAFSRAGTEQTIIFYQFCQTGNGLGEVGLVLIENNKVLRNYLSNVGWSVGARALPDINQNGLDEFALYYSGGIHQGAGGTGVDIMEFTASGLKGLGWFQAESFGEESGDFSYKVTAKPGKAPLFYREKFVNTTNGKWRRVGAAAPLRLKRVVASFQPVK